VAEAQQKQYISGVYTVEEQTTYNIVRLRPKHTIHPIWFKVKGWETKEVAQLLDLTLYRYFWFECRKRIIEKGEDVEVLRIQTVIESSSSFYYINSYVETLDDVEARNDVEERGLIERMKNLKWNSVVTSVIPEENWHYEFRDKDFLVGVNGEVVNNCL
jgi:hypothetical protein